MSVPSLDPRDRSLGGRRARCTLAASSSSTTAGIRTGEILVRVAGSERRSITTLYDATRARTLSVETVLGENTSLELAMTCIRSPGDDLSPGSTAPSAAAAAHTL